jgi:pyridoxine 5-phosphate synthase
MTKLSVNVNKVATLRNTRKLGIPSVTRAARLALDAGAHGITVHPRPDQRHIRPHDIVEIADLLHAYPEAEYNIEGNPGERYQQYARDVRPAQCTLVPDAADVLTSDQGWNLAREGGRLKPIIESLHSFGCRVSLFMDAVPDAISLVPRTGADRVELYTGPYAEAFAIGAEHAPRPYVAAAQRALDLGLGINAGHDLNLENLGPFLDAVPGVLEVSIGHALIGDALEIGLPEAVRRYVAIVSRRGGGA